MSDVAPLSILIIDADERSRNFLSALLGRQGHTVLTASLAKEGYITALRDRPDIIIFDPSLPDMLGEELTRKLRNDKRTSQMILVALAPALNQAEMAGLLGAGCNQYLVKSNEAIEKIVQIVANPIQVEQATSLASVRKKGGFLVVFFSAKGGIGTTSLCANVAQLVAARNKEASVSVMDLVLPIGSVSSLVDYRGDYGLIKAMGEPAGTLTPEFLRHKLVPMDTWRFRLLAGSPDPESSNALDFARIPDLVAAMQDAFDVVFVDLGRSLSRISLSLLQEADVAVMVVSTDKSTSVLTRTTWDHLQVKGIQHKNMYVILNRAVGLEGLSKTEAEQLIGLQIQATFPYLDSSFTIANNLHIPVLKKFPNNTAALMLDQIARQIMATASKVRS